MSDAEAHHRRYSTLTRPHLQDMVTDNLCWSSYTVHHELLISYLVHLRSWNVLLDSYKSRYRQDAFPRYFFAHFGASTELSPSPPLPSNFSHVWRGIVFCWCTFFPLGLTMSLMLSIVLQSSSMHSPLPFAWGEINALRVWRQILLPLAHTMRGPRCGMPLMSVFTRSRLLRRRNLGLMTGLPKDCCAILTSFSLAMQKLGDVCRAAGAVQV